MSDEKVSFDSTGGYRIGVPLQEMDVHTPRDSARRGVQIVSPPKENAGGAVASTPTADVAVKKFDLTSLRRATEAAESKPQEEAPAQEESQATAATVVEEPTPVEQKPTTSAPEEVAAAEEISSQPREESVVQEEQAATEAPAPVEDVVPPQPAKSEQPAFSLARLGLANNPIKQSTAEKEQPAVVASMQLEQSTENPVQAEDVPVGASEAEAMNYAAETPFEVVKLRNIFDMLLVPDYAICDWLDRVSKAYAKMPTAVFQCGFHPNLRVYSMTFTTGRRTEAVNFTLGVGKKITLCTYDGKRRKFYDASSEISVSGTCAIVAGAPVASCGQRDRKAQTL